MAHHGKLVYTPLLSDILGETGSSVMCFLHKRDDLSPILAHVLMHFQGIGGREGRTPGACWLASLPESVSFKISEKSGLKI